MRMHFISHASFEALGAIEEWVTQKGHVLSGSAPYKGEAIASVEQFDFLIVMGGPQSPLEIDRYPYFSDELALIKAAIAANKKVLGICLGAQLIAEALGATTEKSEHREMGCFTIETLATDPIFDQFPASFKVMHWHNDMPGLPDDAVLLASSAGCSRQAFRYGDRVYGLQFHLEFTQLLMKGLIAHCQDDLKAGTYINSSEELMNVDFAAINAKLYRLLDYFESL
ncbi:MAG: GMP synthase [Gammaproteobacteria bacterium]|nr:GMP synthase [Gammaproteobacteria bacterium]